MIPDIYKIICIGDGFLAIMARPRSGDWLEDEVAELKTLGVTAVLSLLEIEEERELGLQDEGALCVRMGMTFDRFPIPDRGVPDSHAVVRAIGMQYFEAMSAGQGVVIHCRAGIGRSALMAAAVLFHNGHDAEAALERIASSRGVPVPDTKEQRDWVLRHWEMAI